MKTQAFNPFDYLETQEEIDAYLQACFDDEDPRVFINALGHLARHQGVSDVARAAGLNRESLYKVFNGKAQPKWDTVRRLMRAMGVHLVVERDSSRRAHG